MIKKFCLLIIIIMSIIVLFTCTPTIVNTDNESPDSALTNEECRLIIGLRETEEDLSSVKEDVSQYLQSEMDLSTTTRSEQEVFLQSVHPMQDKVEAYKGRAGSGGLSDRQIADIVYREMESAYERALYRDFMITVERSQVEEAIQILADHPDVAYIQEDTLHILDYSPNDPYYTRGYLWGLPKTNCDQAWDISQGEGVIVAVIDSGVDGNHPDLKDHLWRNSQGTWGWDFSDNDAYPSPDGDHGTHVAGTIAAIGNNSQGVIGVAPQVKIMAVKIFPNAYSSVSANAIRYAVDNGAKVLNNSWGPQNRSVSDRTIENAIEYAHSKGAVIVFAAGNSNDNADYYHGANHPKTISVGAVDNNFRKASFSNYGSSVDISAPGVTIYSTLPGNRYGQMSGTSMAAPHVAGLAALILSRYPSYNNEKVREVMKANAIAISSTGMGAGVMDALACLEEGGDIPTPEPAVITGVSDPIYANEDFSIYGTGFGSQKEWGYIIGDNSVSESFGIVSWSDGEIVVDNTYAAGNYRVWVWDADNNAYSEPYSITISTRETEPTGYFTLTNKYTGKLMRPYNAGTENGTEVVQYSNQNWQSQQWQFVDLGNGYYLIKNRYTSDILWVLNSSYEDNTNVVMYQEVTNPTQYDSIQWKIENLGNGYYCIVNKLSGKCLRPYNASTADNTNIVQYTWQGYNSQQWQLTPVN